MLSLLIYTDVFLYSIMQLIHMYKQLYTTKNSNHAGGGYTIVFYAIEFHMFICSVQHMNICSCVHMLYL